MSGESYFSFFNFILARSIVPSPWTNNEMWLFWLPTPCLPLLCFFWVSFQYFCISFLYPSPLPFTPPPPPQSMSLPPQTVILTALQCSVSKMISASEQGSFFNSWTCFSDLRIIGPNYVPGEKNDEYVKSVQRTVIWMGKKQEIVEDVPYGNTVAMVDSDQFITKEASLIN
ncbi:hypothetical protein PVL29_013638 [Vitis rotundifolia]|uniref:Uncharacterized protein n=1 Tax=Vitis rotundifolia TaxID=103349 RepID=A0AA38ZLX8_VITRO|nr:hypothetical protein PVL29_013638 [Vitis rotundifolia]